MIWQLAAAGLLAALAALVHLAAGERTNIRHLLASDVPPGEKIELRAVWHFASLALGLSAGVLLLAAFSPGSVEARAVVRALAAYLAACAVVWVGLVLAARRDWLLKLPQWALLLGIAGLAWWGAAAG